MKLIFVLILISRTGGGWSTSMQEFGSKDSCEAAKTEVVGAMSVLVGVQIGICVQK